MASNEVQLGGGYASGMFYTAPANTALPTYPGDDLTAWTEVGDIDADGITFTPRDSDTLKNWAGQPKRVIPGADPATVSAKIMDTTKTALTAIFGSVTETAATADHGKLLTIDMDSKPAAAAFLFVMKDGDDMMMIGCTQGQVSAVDNVSFAPGAAINWTPTITAMGDDGFKLIMKEATGATGATGAS